MWRQLSAQAWQAQTVRAKPNSVRPGSMTGRGSVAMAVSSVGRRTKGGRTGGDGGGFGRSAAAAVQQGQLGPAGQVRLPGERAAQALDGGELGLGVALDGQGALEQV